ncbi:MAG: N-acetyltransferase [Arcobacter sp.]|nr:MAG: N-acetyltransferase [Arcobacter sp.]
MKKEYIIRKAKLDDIEVLLTLFQKHALYEKSDFIAENKKQSLKKYLFDEKILNCLVIEIDNKIIAYTTYLKQFSTWDVNFYLYLDCLFIEEEFRKLGLGAQLMNNIKEEAKKLGCNQIQWQTPSFNENAIKFYNKIGANSKSKKRFFLEI